jgi:hypothetical protein
MNTIKFKKSTNEILIKLPDCGYWYPVDLDRCEDAKEVLDWIIHMKEKGLPSDTLMDFISELEARGVINRVLYGEK